MNKLAREANIELAVLVAVTLVESSGTIGNNLIRFENHLQSREIEKDITAGQRGPKDRVLFDGHLQHGGRKGISGKPWENHKYREDSQQDATWNRFHGNQILERKVLKMASRLFNNEEQSHGCASIGPFQVLGKNHDLVGYPSPKSFYDAMEGQAGGNPSRDILVAQMCSGVDFSTANKGRPLSYLRGPDKNWIEFAKLYNGSGQKEKYARDLKNAYAIAQKVIRGH